MNAAELYREESFTDRQVGTIRRLTPVTESGAEDASRATLFLGQAQVMTPMGAMPLAFEIEGQNLAEAVTNYGPAAKEAMDRAAEELAEMRRQAASKIVVPGSEGMGGMGGGPAPGKIQMR